MNTNQKISTLLPVVSNDDSSEAGASENGCNRSFEISTSQAAEFQVLLNRFQSVCDEPAALPVEKSHDTMNSTCMTLGAEVTIADEGIGSAVKLSKPTENFLAYNQQFAFADPIKIEDLKSVTVEFLKRKYKHFSENNDMLTAEDRHKNIKEENDRRKTQLVSTNAKSLIKLDYPKGSDDIPSTFFETAEKDNSQNDLESWIVPQDAVEGLLLLGKTQSEILENDESHEGSEVECNMLSIVNSSANVVEVESMELALDSTCGAHETLDCNQALGSAEKRSQLIENSKNFNQPFSLDNLIKAEDLRNVTVEFMKRKYEQFSENTDTQATEDSYKKMKDEDDHRKNPVPTKTKTPNKLDTLKTPNEIPFLENSDFVGEGSSQNCPETWIVPQDALEGLLLLGKTETTSLKSDDLYESPQMEHEPSLKTFTNVISAKSTEVVIGPSCEIPESEITKTIQVLRNDVKPSISTDNFLDYNQQINLNYPIKTEDLENVTAEFSKRKYEHFPENIDNPANEDCNKKRREESDFRKSPVSANAKTPNKFYTSKPSAGIPSVRLGNPNLDEKSNSGSDIKEWIIPQDALEGLLLLGRTLLENTISNEPYKGHPIENELSSILSPLSNVDEVESIEVVTKSSRVVYETEVEKRNKVLESIENLSRKTENFRIHNQELILDNPIETEDLKKVTVDVLKRKQYYFSEDINILATEDHHKKLKEVNDNRKSMVSENWNTQNIIGISKDLDKPNILGNFDLANEGSSQKNHEAVILPQDALEGLLLLGKTGGENASGKTDDGSQIESNQPSILKSFENVIERESTEAILESSSTRDAEVAEGNQVLEKTKKLSKPANDFLVYNQQFTFEYPIQTEQGPSSLLTSLKNVMDVESKKMAWNLEKMRLEKLKDPGSSLSSNNSSTSDTKVPRANSTKLLTSLKIRPVSPCKGDCDHPQKDQCNSNKRDAIAEITIREVPEDSSGPVQKIGESLTLEVGVETKEEILRNFLGIEIDHELLPLARNETSPDLNDGITKYDFDTKTYVMCDSCLNSVDEKKQAVVESDQRINTSLSLNPVRDVDDNSSGPEADLENNSPIEPLEESNEKTQLKKKKKKLKKKKR